MDWKLFALGSAFFAGLTAILSKIGVKEVPSNLATLIRIIVLLPVVILIVQMRGEWRPLSAIPRHTLLFLAFSGIATGLSWLCYYRALQLGPASIVSPIDKSSVIISVLLAVSLLGERLRTAEWIGLGLILIGTLTMALA